MHADSKVCCCNRGFIGTSALISHLIMMLASDDPKDPGLEYKDPELRQLIHVQACVISSFVWAYK